MNRKIITHEEFLKEVEEIFKDCLNILNKKNKDYSEQSDALKNFFKCEELGICSAELGILIRIMDKFSRLTNIIKNNGVVHVEDEKLEDTIKDLINYLAILLVVHKSKTT